MSGRILAVDHGEVLNYRSEREGREEGQTAHDQDDADQKADKQAAVGREGAGRGWKRLLGRERALGEMPGEKLNVNGGAIALGHPVGATGAMLIGTLLDELQRRQVEHGVVTMCTGLGMGVATVLRQV